MSLNVCPLHAVETSRRCTPLGQRCQLHLNLFIVAFMQLLLAIIFSTPISSFYLFVTSQPPSSNNTDEIVSGSVDCSKPPSGSLSHTPHSPHSPPTPHSPPSPTTHTHAGGLAGPGAIRHLLLLGHNTPWNSHPLHFSGSNVSTIPFIFSSFDGVQFSHPYHKWSHLCISVQTLGHLGFILYSWCWIQHVRSVGDRLHQCHSQITASGGQQEKNKIYVQCQGQISCNYPHVSSNWVAHRTRLVEMYGDCTL